MLTLSAVDPEEVRAQYKIVRRDTLQDVPGLILSASEQTGICQLRETNGISVELNFGPSGLRIVTR